jgi:integrase
LKPDDIDWAKRLLYVRRAITLDETGKRVEGNTKNKYSRRTIKLTTAMFEALKQQKEIHVRLGCEYFFCTPKGFPVHLSNLRKMVRIPALKRAGVKVREIKLTRHTFAAIALSCGENPLWIAKIMGHRDAEMVIKVYSRYVKNLRGTEDGSTLDAMFQCT